MPLLKVVIPRLFDREEHRPGQCTVQLAAMYQTCPRLQLFAGVDVSKISHQMCFQQWNLAMKKRFYAIYQKNGGDKDYNNWKKSRWFKKQIKLSSEDPIVA